MASVNLLTEPSDPSPAWKAAGEGEGRMSAFPILLLLPYWGCRADASGKELQALGEPVGLREPQGDWRQGSMEWGH